MDDGRATDSEDTRAERLSRALRDNLKRRKAQARARLASPEEAEARPATDSDGEL